MKFSKILLVSLLLGFTSLLPTASASNPMSNMMNSAGNMMRSGADAANDMVDSAKDATNEMLDSMIELGAEESTDKTFVWSNKVIKSILQGDAIRGKELAKKGKCASCHGDTGISDEDDTPSIAGQVAAYTYKQLHEYKEKIRDSKSMYKKVKSLSNQDMIDLSTWYAAQNPEAMLGGKIPPLVNVGDTKRFLIPCASCHNKDAIQRGFQTPIISGQKSTYFNDTMLAFKEGDRINDHYKLMRSIASRLTEEEIEELATYYGAPAAEDEEEDEK